MLHGPSLPYDGKYKFPNQETSLHAIWDVARWVSHLTKPFTLFVNRLEAVRNSEANFSWHSGTSVLTHYWKWKPLSHVWLFATPWVTVHGILQARVLEWVAFPFSRGIFTIQWSNPGLPHCRWILYQLSHSWAGLLKSDFTEGSWFCKNMVLV